VLAMRF